MSTLLSVPEWGTQCDKWALMGRALVGRPSPWALMGLALMGQANMGPRALLGRALMGLALMGPMGPNAPPCALVGWDLMGRSLVGRALMDPQPDPSGPSPIGPSPHVAPWVLVGQALMGREPMGLPVAKPRCTDLHGKRASVFRISQICTVQHGRSMLIRILIWHCL